MLRNARDNNSNKLFVINLAANKDIVSLLDDAAIAPLCIYHNDGTRTINFAPAELARLIANLSANPSPEDILDYIYAVLHSRSYLERYEDFLKTDFPNNPVAI